ncbi:hypothetical protein [Zestomonas carbonaria]|uniref:hypothetical protein n=1 Tax=Zestomonas carbonaria TaxID=2762745 RepID=UPI0038B663A7
MGAGSKPQTIGFRYYMDIQFGIGKAMDGLLAIRASGKTAWQGNVTSNQTITINAPDLFGGDKGEGGIQGTLDVMFGEEDQPVNSRLAAALGGLVPAFRGFAGGFFSGMVSAMNPYPKPWELLRWRALKGWDGAPWYPETCLISLAGGQIRAMNPAHIIYETYTNREWGRGLDRGMMDDTAFRAAALKLYNEGFGLCLEYKRSASLAEFRDLVCNHIGAHVGPDRRTGLITLELIRDDYNPDDLPLFDEDSGLLSIEEDESSSALIAPSQLYVEYDDAIDGQTRRARAVNMAIAQAQRGQAVEVVSYPGLPTAELAGRVVARDMRVKGSNLRKFKVRLDRRGWSIGPAKAFRVRSLKRGIETIVLRAGRIEDGTLSNGSITITALQDVFGLPASSFIPVPPNGYVPPDRTPQPILMRRLIEVPYRELAGRIDPANLALVPASSAWMAAVAVWPTSLSFSYNLATRLGGSGDFIERGAGDWCPTAQLVGALSISATSATLTGGIDLDRVTLGQAALLDDEIVRVDAIDLVTGAITLGRGCADTVPVAHAAGARVWFYDGFEGVDDTEYSSGLSVQARLLTNTSMGQLNPNLAGTDTLALVGRQGRPYPPGRLLVNGASYPAEVAGEVTVSCAHRDRLQQADQLIDTTIGNIGPEAGVQYRFRFYSGNDLKRTIMQAGNSYTYPFALELSDGGPFVPLRVVVDAVRSDVFSLQAHDISVGRGLDYAMFRAAGDEVSNTLSLTLTIPVGVQPGDLLVAFVCRRDAWESVPAGWTLAGSGGTWSAAQGYTDSMDVYTRIAEPGDAGSTVTWALVSNPVNGATYGHVMAFFHGQGDTLEVKALGKTEIPYTTGAVSAWPCAPVTTTAANQAIIVAQKHLLGTATDQTLVAPTGYITTTGTAGAPSRRLAVGYRSFLEAGFTASGNFVRSAALANDSVTSISLVIGSA